MEEIEGAPEEMGWRQVVPPQHFIRVRASFCVTTWAFELSRGISLISTTCHTAAPLSNLNIKRNRLFRYSIILLGTSAGDECGGSLDVSLDACPHRDINISASLWVLTPFTITLLAVGLAVDGCRCSVDITKKIKTNTSNG